MYEYFIGPDGVFPTPLTAFAFTAILIFYMLWETQFKTRAPKDAKREGRKSFQIHFLVVPASLLAPLICGFLKIGVIRGEYREAIVWIGLMLMLGGRVLRLWAQTQMKHLFVGELAVQKDHRVVTTGPYKYIRHPAYVGGTLSAIGIGLALSTWLGALIAGGVLIASYITRIPKEEALLASEMGDEYRDYMKQTKRFVPFVF
jgi:protein-S-isoprenylcysteine O-methyltransferase Ste14